MTKAILNAFAKQGDTSQKQPDQIDVIAKFFNPMGAGTWYCYEYNPDDRIFWGFANLGDPAFAECGTISLDELESVRLPLGLSIERDMYFPPMKLSEVIEKVKKGEHI